MFVNVASKCASRPKQGLASDLRKVPGPGLRHRRRAGERIRQARAGQRFEIAEILLVEVQREIPDAVEGRRQGDRPSALYGYLTSKRDESEFAGDIKWNFTKFLVSREGKVVNRFEPRIDPASAEIKSAIERNWRKKYRDN